MTQPAPLPDDENARLNALRECCVLDTAPEPAFDDLTAIAAHICDVPIALVSLLDESRQWFKSKVGVDALETRRDIAFCAHAILRPEEVMQVSDATQDERFKANPLVSGEPHIRFYAGAPLVTAQGHALGTLCVIDRVPRSLTVQQVQALAALGRQVVAQFELRRSLHELRQSNRDLEQFAYIASHDLQEPLRTITSYVELLQRRYVTHLDSKALEFMGYAVDAARRMRTLIQDLLAYSQVGTEDLQVEPIDLDAVVRDIRRDLSPQIDDAQASIHAQDLPIVKADRSQLAMLLRNLIGNALKYRGDRAAQVRVDVEPHKAYWQFCVSDNGIGIEPKNHALIFELFKRLHPRSEYGGTGIGLAMCQRIVKRVGGRIWVNSRPGSGTRFYFTLPRYV